MAVKETFLFKLVRAHGTHPTTFYGRVRNGWNTLDAISKPASRKYLPKPVEKAPEFDIVKIIEQERKELRMDRVEEFFNPVVSEVYNDDFDDTETRVNALKRSFDMMYKQKSPTK